MPVESKAASRPVRAGVAASSLVAAGIFLSRIAGLIREHFIGRYFGVSLYADVIRAGLRMPNILQNLLGEGTLSASFIPVYAELLEQGREEEADRVAGAIFALLFAVAGALALAGVLFAPVLTDIFLPGFDGERRELTIQLTRIIFPMTGTLVLSAWALGILNSHRRFFISYVAPVVWNASMIGALILFGGRLDQPRLVMAFGWGALLGGVLQFGVQLPFVIRLARHLEIHWNTRLEPVREAVRNAGPAILGRGVVQLSGYIDIVLASLLVTGALAQIGYAMIIYMLPISLFGMSVAAAELPELSRQRTTTEDALRLRTNAGLRRIAFYVIPSFVAILLLGDLMVSALYRSGRFDMTDTVVVYVILVGFSSGLLASSSTRLFSSTFFALRDTRTPAIIAAVRVAVSGVLGFAFMVQFEPVQVFGQRIGPGLMAGWNVAGRPLGAFGLALAAGVAAWIEWSQLRRILRRRIGAVGTGVGPLIRMFAAALAAAAVAWGARLELWRLIGRSHPIPEAIVVFGVFGLIYFSAAAALRLPEVGGLAARVRSFTRPR